VIIDSWELFGVWLLFGVINVSFMLWFKSRGKDFTFFNGVFFGETAVIMHLYDVSLGIWAVAGVCSALLWSVALDDFLFGLISMGVVHFSLWLFGGMALIGLVYWVCKKFVKENGLSLWVDLGIFLILGLFVIGL
jgi:hypothetical protein